jgi:hypothetical protein
MLAPDYTTAERLKKYLGDETDVDDAFVAAWITAVSRNIDQHCGRSFGNVDEATEFYYTPKYDRRRGKWFATIHDLRSDTGLSIVREDATAITDGYKLLPGNNAALGKPFEQIRFDSCPGGEVAMESDQWGWADVPPSIEVGMWLQAARLAARRDSPFGIAGSPSTGSEMRLLAKVDPDFLVTLKPFVRRWWAA